MGERFLGSGGSHASCLSIKGLLKREIKLQKALRDGADHGEAEADAQGMWIQKNTTPTTRDMKGTRPPVEAGRGRGEA